MKSSSGLTHIGQILWRVQLEIKEDKEKLLFSIKSEMNIQHIPLSKFLSCDKTKSDLTKYLADKTLEYNKVSSKLIITSTFGVTRINKDLVFVENNHEEADTLLIHRGVLAS